MKCPVCSVVMEEEHDIVKHISGTYYVATKRYFKCPACDALVHVAF